jgi:hypothetical protein
MQLLLQCSRPGCFSLLSHPSCTRAGRTQQGPHSTTVHLCEKHPASAITRYKKETRDCHYRREAKRCLSRRMMVIAWIAFACRLGILRYIYLCCFATSPQSCRLPREPLSTSLDSSLPSQYDISRKQSAGGQPGGGVGKSGYAVNKLTMYRCRSSSFSC